MDTRNTTDRDPLFDALRAEVGRLQAPRAVEHDLLQAFARLHPPRKRWYHALAGRSRALAGGLAGLAAGALALAFALRGPAPVDGAGKGTLAARDDNGVFIALDSAERIAAEPAPRVVAADVPRTSLAALGVPLTPDNAGESVRAEMLVGADGRPLAVRLCAIE